MQIDPLLFEHLTHAILDLVALVWVQVGKPVAGHEYPGHVRPHRHRVRTQPVIIVASVFYPVVHMGQRRDRDVTIVLDPEHGETQVIAVGDVDLLLVAPRQDALQGRVAALGRHS